jgi:RND family efflux transporter MFP subunit
MRYLKSFALIAAAGLLALSSACRPAAKGTPPGAAAVGAAPVKVFKVARRRISEKLIYTGTIEAWQRINIMPDVGGKIAKICVNEGDRVAKDQLLAEMDTAAIVLQLRQAEAAQAVARANLANARTNLDRMDRLAKEKAVSDQQHEQVKLGYDAAAAQLAQAEAAVNLAKHSLDVSIMKAPFGGVIASKNAEVGDVINPMMGSMSATSGVLTLVDFTRVKIAVDVSGTDILRVHKGQVALLGCPNLPGQTFKGAVSVVNLAADPATKKFRIEVAIDNPDLALRPGTFGEVTIEVSTREDALAVPQKAILDNKYVFIAQGGKAVRREVVLGLQNTTLVEVASGVAEGDQVIAEGNFGLEDGAAVDIIGEVQP